MGTSAGTSGREASRKSGPVELLVKFKNSQKEGLVCRSKSANENLQDLHLVITKVARFLPILMMGARRTSRRQWSDGVPPYDIARQNIWPARRRPPHHSSIFCAPCAKMPPPTNTPAAVGKPLSSDSTSLAGMHTSPNYYFNPCASQKFRRNDRVSLGGV